MRDREAIGDPEANVARRVRRRTLGTALRTGRAKDNWAIRDLSLTGAFIETTGPIPQISPFDVSDDREVR